jgi:hypothetical protein
MSVLAAHVQCISSKEGLVCHSNIGRVLEFPGKLILLAMAISAQKLNDIGLSIGITSGSDRRL